MSFRKLFEILLIIFVVTINYENISYGKSLMNNYKINSKIIDLKKYDALNLDNTANAFIEIEAGENLKWEFNEKNNSIEVEIKNGKPRKINYLGYPFNYGFIVNTKLKKKFGGDGDPLDIIVLDQHKVNRGELIRVKVIGMIGMKDKGLIDNKILSVSLDSKFEEIQNIKDLEFKYPGVIDIIKIWFENYKGEKIQILRTFSKKEAIKFIKKTTIPVN